MKTNRIVTATILATALIISLPVQNTAQATIQPSACFNGFTNTWIVSEAPAQIAGFKIEANDALDIYCDTAHGGYSIDLYRASDLQTDSLIRYPLCPANGEINFQKNSSVVLQCNFWDASSNQVKTISMQQGTNNISNPEQTIDFQIWISDANGGIAGRPDNGGKAHSSGNGE